MSHHDKTSKIACNPGKDSDQPPVRSVVTVCSLDSYRNDPKFSDRKVGVNSADPDQTAPRGAVCSGSSLFAFPFASF